MDDFAENMPPEDREVSALSLPPHSMEAEQSVLGGMMLSKDAIADVIEQLRGRDFYRPAHEVVYEAILDRRLDPANFRRQVDTSGTLIPTDGFRTGSHRPARLYRYDHDVELAERGPLPE